MRCLSALLLASLLMGCSSVKTNEEPYIIKGPEDAAIFIEGYREEEIFYGYEASIAFPFLEPIPIIGTFLSGKLISLRSGAVRPIFVPEYKEKTYATQSTRRPSRTPPALSVPFSMQRNELQGCGVGGR